MSSNLDSKLRYELPKEMKWKIGNVEIPNRFVLAPMAGVTDLAFRRLCKEQGAGLLCMEMISAKAISYKNKNTRALMEIDPVEHPISMQLFGSEPELMAEVAKEIEEEPFDILDINMGCPVPKVVNNGEGSPLLKNPELIVKIVKSISSAIQKPLTVKVRIGFENEPVDIVEMDAIRALTDADQIVVACGGGGIPVLSQDNHLKGASAVIEKDLAAGKLAELLEADMLVILTSVDNVCLDYGTENERPLSSMTVAEAKKYMEQGQFGEGDMQPKIQAAIDFIGDSAIRSVLITKLHVDGSQVTPGMGTMITK